jgi:hypothetical protein
MSGYLFGIICDEAFAIIYTRTYGETVSGYNDEWAVIWMEYDSVFRPVAISA